MYIDIIRYADDTKNPTSIAIPPILGIGFFIFAVISTLIGQGIIEAILVGVVLGVIIYYGGMIALGLLIIVTRIIFTILRYVFYNIYTLGIVVLLLIFNQLR